MAGPAFDHVLLSLPADVNRVLADSADDHGGAAAHAGVGGRGEVVDRDDDHGIGTAISCRKNQFKRRCMSQPDKKNNTIAVSISTWLLITGNGGCRDSRMATATGTASGV